MQFRLNKFAVLCPVTMVMSVALLAGCDQDTPKPAANSTAPTVSTTAPTATISATPSQIAAGDLVTIEWTTTDATNVTISNIGNVPTSGKRTVSPPVTTTYRLVAKGDGGRAEAATVVSIIKPTEGVKVDMPPAILAQTPEQEFTAIVKDVFFDYDAYDVRADSQPTLSQDASYLVSHPNVNIIVGGYCDERGSNEYNLALGENRANAVKDALVNSGVAASRIRIVSFGKEQPFCIESTEECWQQNRRAGIKLDLPEKP